MPCGGHRCVDGGHSEALGGRVRRWEGREVVVVAVLGAHCLRVDGGVGAAGRRFRAGGGGAGAGGEQCDD